jgi:hypothetical protein
MVAARLCCTNIVLHYQSVHAGEDLRIVVHLCNDDEHAPRAQLRRTTGEFVQEITGERLNMIVRAQNLLSEVIESTHTVLPGQEARLPS